MFKAIPRYYRLYKAFVKYTFAREVEFRGDFLSYTFVNLLWAGFSVFIMGLFYTQTDNIAGWGLGEAFTLLATWHVVNAVLTFFVRRNFSKLPDEIKDGDLDVIVTKPVNMQFFVSLKHIDLPKIFNLFFAIALLVFGMSRVGVDATLSGVLAYIILVIAGIMIGYSLWFGVLTLSFKYLGMSNLEMLFDSVFRFARFPADAFTFVGKALLFTAIPLGVMTQLPAEALSRGLAWPWVVYGVGIAALFFWIATSLWNRQIRKYASASS